MIQDEAIVDLFFERNESAIRFTSEKYGERLRNTAYRIVEDHTISEECENDTYLTAWNRIPPNNPKGYLFAFLARIIRHLAIDRVRAENSQKRKAQLVELSNELVTPSNVDSEIEARLLGESISNWLATLESEKRILFVRRYFYMDSISEISTRFHLGESKVKTTLMRLRKLLREHLRKEGITV